MYYYLYLISSNELPIEGLFYRKGNFMLFKMNNKVKIISSKKTDGRYNYGTIIGIEKEEDGFYLGVHE
jgi:hypothetical protein